MSKGGKITNGTEVPGQRHLRCLDFGLEAKPFRDGPKRHPVVLLGLAGKTKEGKEDEGAEDEYPPM